MPLPHGHLSPLPISLYQERRREEEGFPHLGWGGGQEGDPSEAARVERGAN